MNRKVLLLEPNYHNKYPPMGLMKIAMYYRLQGDNVVFYKGDLEDFVVSEYVCESIKKLEEIDSLGEINSNWRKYTPEITKYIRAGKIQLDSEFEEQLLKNSLYKGAIECFRKKYIKGEYYENPRWDKVGVTTLFTFYWDITIKTIEFAKKICKEPSKNLMIGGVLASVVPAAVEKATGIKPYVGCLNIKKFKGDKALPKPFNNTTIDALPLDYSILDEIDYRYPATDAYFSYTTRGCINKCAFCAVPILEPEYQDYIPIKKRIDLTDEMFGKKRNLLLLDNNIFASKSFDKIIDEIKDAGFHKNAKVILPNQLEITIKQLKTGWNDRANLKKAVLLLNQYLEMLDGEQYDTVYALLANNNLFHAYTATKTCVINVYNQIKDDYQKKLTSKPITRYVDFNQGMDARLATPDNMKKLSTINIQPLRIAFDHWSLREEYVNAIKLASDNGIRQMSNYLLYNFNDKPVDLYNRLLLNIDLCDVLGVNIYSFPMKYHPIMDEKWFSNRDYIGKFWSRKSIRTIQAVLNSTMGKIGRGRTFFFKAFGRNEREFSELLYTPESFIIKRFDAEISGLTNEWRTSFERLNDKEKEYVKNIVDQNNFDISIWKKENKKIRNVLDFYLIKREDVKEIDNFKKQEAIKNFEKNCTSAISEECERLLNKLKYN